MVRTLLYGGSVEDSDWMHSLPGYSGEVKAIKSASYPPPTKDMSIVHIENDQAMQVKAHVRLKGGPTSGWSGLAKDVTASIRIKGSASSGWYAPGKGTHTGEAHAKVGSGKAGAKFGKVKVAKPVTKFFSGNKDTATIAQMYKGSSLEIQELANKTGILALDDDSEVYIRGLLDRGLIEDKSLTIATKTGLSVLDGEAAKDHGYTTGQEFYDHNIGWATTATQAGYMGNALEYHDIDMKSGMTKSILTGATAEELEVARMASDIYHEEYVGYQNGTMSYTEYTDRVANAVAERMTLGQQTMMSNLYARAQLATGLDSKLKSDPKYDNDMARRWQPISVGDLPSGEIPGDFNIKGFAVNYWNQYADKPLNVKTTPPTNKMTALEGVDTPTLVRVTGRVQDTWDRENHATFSADVNGVYRIHTQSRVANSYQKAYDSRDNESTDLYHGTDYEGAVGISTGGYKVPKTAKIGRMMGDGTYLAANSSKSVQYVGDRFGRGGATGVLLVNRAAMGTVGEFDRSYGMVFTDTDTVHAAKGAFGLVNEEWCVRDPKAVMPDYWVDVTRR